MSVDELERAATRLNTHNKGDAGAIMRAVKAIRRGKATKAQIAHARKLARGVRS